ncbi:hypothetical protein BC827DRAFT_1199879 [Russula dissimulans]|nr:hypothetical protein BC827DRAFT_1199879 [Russula dissimulans]
MNLNVPPHRRPLYSVSVYDQTNVRLRGSHYTSRILLIRPINDQDNLTHVLLSPSWIWRA